MFISQIQLRIYGETNVAVDAKRARHLFTPSSGLRVAGAAAHVYSCFGCLENGKHFITIISLSLPLSPLLVRALLYQ